MNIHDLMELCMRPAPLGGEEEAKNWLRSMMPDTVEITEDPAGSLIVRKPGKRPGIAFMASLSQPALLVTGGTAEGSWLLRPFGAGENLEAVSGWEVTDGQTITTTVQFEDGKLRRAPPGNAFDQNQALVPGQAGSELYQPGGLCWLLVSGPASAVSAGNRVRNNLHLPGAGSA